MWTLPWYSLLPLFSPQFPVFLTLCVECTSNNIVFPVIYHWFNHGCPHWLKYITWLLHLLTVVSIVWNSSDSVFLKLRWILFSLDKSTDTNLWFIWILWLKKTHNIIMLFPNENINIIVSFLIANKTMSPKCHRVLSSCIYQYQYVISYMTQVYV